MWVARDKNGNLYLYSIKPEKGNVQWQIPANESGIIAKLDSELVPSVKWEDEEPTEVDIIPKTNQNEKHEKSKSIDWEQRRYEIAKEMLSLGATEYDAEYAVKCADSLIKELRKGE